MSLNELMGWDGAMTHRQFLLWQQWLANQQNVPSRADHYAMAIRYEVARSRGELISEENLRVKFAAPSKQDNSVDVERSAAIAKSRWRGRQGKKQQAKD